MFFLKNAKLKREEELRRLKADGAKKAGLAFVAGSAIAAVVTLFTAPKSGKEMRQDVAKKVEEGADFVKESGEALVVKTAEVLEETLEKGKNIKEKVASKFEKSKSQKAINQAEAFAKDAVENVADASREAAETLEETIEEIKE